MASNRPPSTSKQAGILPPSCVAAGSSTTTTQPKSAVSNSVKPTAKLDQINVRASTVVTNGTGVPPAKEDSGVAKTNQLKSKPEPLKQALSLVESTDSVNANNGASYVALRKKSSFQITKVVTKDSDQNDTKDLDATDDPDEAVTDEMSSDLFESSRLTDGDHGPSSADTLHSPLLDDLLSGGGQGVTVVSTTTHAVLTTSTPGKEKDVHSRFKIVKIESKDHSKRGRWLCFDFADPAGSSPGKTNVANGPVDGKPPVSMDPIYYFPSVDMHHAKSPFAPAIVYNEGHPMLERNPLESPMYVKQKTQFFQGDGWDVGGEAASKAKQSVGGALTLQHIIVTEPADVASVIKQAEVLSPKSSSELMSALSKRNSQSSPLFAMVTSSMNPLSVTIENEDSYYEEVMRRVTVSVEELKQVQQGESHDRT